MGRAHSKSYPPKHFGLNLIPRHCVPGFRAIARWIFVSLKQAHTRRNTEFTVSCGFRFLFRSLLIRQLDSDMCRKVLQFYKSFFAFVHFFFFKIRSLDSMSFVICFNLASVSEGNPLFLSSFSI